MKSPFSTSAFYVLLTASVVAALQGSSDSDNNNNDIRGRRHLQGGNECVPYQRIVMNDDRTNDEDWHCKFSIEDAAAFGGQEMIPIEGLTNEEMKELAVVSAKSVFHLGPSSYVETPPKVESNIFDRSRAENAKLRIVKEEGFEITKMNASDPRRGRRSRRLTDTKGDLETIVVRVKDADGLTPKKSINEMKGDVYGGDGDQHNLKSQMKACSWDQARITATNRKGSGGIAEIQISTEIDDGDTRHSAVENAARTATKSYFDTGSLWNLFDVVIYCLPPGTVTSSSKPSKNWIAYAYVGGIESVYNDDWCGSLSALMHEVGHNLGLQHSGVRGENGEKDNEYADTSGYMGYSYSSDDTPRMCYNSAKVYELRWFDDRTLSIDPLNLPGGSQSYILNGVADYGIGTGYIAIRLKYEGARLVGGIDYYLGFNRKRSINEGTQTNADHVMVLEKENTDGSDAPDGRGDGKSWVIGALSMSGQTSIELDYGDTTVTVEVTRINGYNAFVTITNDDFEGPEPTKPPTQPPTQSPVDSPVQPTDSPTQSPTRTCPYPEDPDFLFTFLNNGIQRTCGWLASRDDKRRTRYCKRPVNRGTTGKRKVFHECKQTCGKQGFGKCSFLKG